MIFLNKRRENVIVNPIILKCLWGFEMAGTIASTAAVIGIIDKAVGIAKKLSNENKEFDKATLKLELANLMVELANVKLETISLQSLLVDSEYKLKKLEMDLEDKAKFTHLNDAYWKEGDGTPYCPQCYENSNKKIHLKCYPNSWWVCSVCRRGVDLKGVLHSSNRA